MLKREFKSKVVRMVFLLLAMTAAEIFAASVFLWFLQLILGLKIGGLDWAYLFWHASPALLLFAMFVTAFVLAWRSRTASVPLTLISLFVAMFCFFYDTSHQNYQIQTNDGSGCKHLYVTWYWYDDSHDPNR